MYFKHWSLPDGGCLARKLQVCASARVAVPLRYSHFHVRILYSAAGIQVLRNRPVCSLWLLFAGTLLALASALWFARGPESGIHSIDNVFSPPSPFFPAPKESSDHNDDYHADDPPDPVEPAVTAWYFPLFQALKEACHDLSNIRTHKIGLERLLVLGILADFDLIVDEEVDDVLRALNEACVAADGSGSYDRIDAFCAAQHRYFAQPINNMYEQRELHPADTSFLDWQRQPRESIERGAAEGYAAARAVLGDLHNQAGHYAQAVKLWRLAADEGQSDALLALGHAFASGTEGVSQDFSEAARLYKLAAARVHWLAFSAIGTAYLQGRGVRKSTHAAVRNLRFGAALGDPYAMYTCITLQC